MAEAEIPRGVKRARQACINCRRKKARCPGERPCCSYCARLRQPCSYDDDPADYAAYASNTNNTGELALRMAMMESKMNELIRSIEAQNADPIIATPIQGFVQPAMTVDNNPRPASAPGVATFDFEQFSATEDIPRATLEQLVDDFFRYSHNQLYSFFHEASFRESMAEGTLPDFLLSAVLMSALRFSNDQYFDSDLFFTNKRKTTADALCRKAWKYISSTFVDGEEDCTVAVVQAVTLLAIFEFIEGRQRTAWVKIGIGAKFAQDLCLMFEPAPTLTFAKQEERRRTFWSIYLLDRLMTCGRARPPVFTDAAITVQLPCSERAFKTGMWEQCEELKRYTGNRVLQSPEPSPMARVCIISALLSRCSQYAIQAQVDSSNNLPPWDVESEWTAINSSLLYLESHVDWQRSLPEILTTITRASPGRDQQRLDYHSAELIVTSQILHHLCYCLLNHYFLLCQRSFLCGLRMPTSFHIHSLQMGLYHAQELNKVMKAALRAGCSVLASFLSYACLVSATIHAVFRHSDILAVREQAAKDLNFNLSFLQRQARYWPNAGTMFKQMGDFCRHSQSYKDLISAVPTQPGQDAVDENGDGHIGALPAQAANRLYALIDYSVQSLLPGGGENDAAVSPWPAGLQSQDLEVDASALT